jgi:hypothetical protein
MKDEHDSSGKKSPSEDKGIWAAVDLGKGYFAALDGDESSV